MTLNFLGQSYEASPAAPMTEPSNLTGKYRGVPMQFHRGPGHAPSTVVPQILQYRGLAYIR